MNGYVADTAFQLLGGARMEVLNGPDAGRELTSAGNYTLTIIADSACAGLPQDVRTRTYAAYEVRSTTTLHV